jgi:hypothetical protein
LGHTDVVVLRQKHQVAARDADLRGQARALGAHGVLDDLHHDGAAFKYLLFNRHQRLARASGCSLAFGVLLPDIGHMQKSRFVQANVDEGRLHAGQNTGHFAQVHIAHQAALERALDMQLLHRAKFDHRDPRFLGRPIDQNILLHGGHQMGIRENNSGNETAPSALWLA